MEMGMAMGDQWEMGGRIYTAPTVKGGKGLMVKILGVSSKSWIVIFAVGSWPATQNLEVPSVIWTRCRLKGSP